MSRKWKRRGVTSAENAGPHQLTDSKTATKSWCPKIGGYPFKTSVESSLRPRMLPSVPILYVLSCPDLVPAEEQSYTDGTSQHPIEENSSPIG